MRQIFERLKAVLRTCLGLKTPPPVECTIGPRPGDFDALCAMVQQEGMRLLWLGDKLPPLPRRMEGLCIDAARFDDDLVLHAHRPVGQMNHRDSA